MNVIIFEDDKSFRNLLRDKIIELGYHVILSTDQLNELQNHLLFNKFAALYLIDIIIGDQAEGFRAFDMIRNSSKSNICVFITDFMDYVIFNPEIKINSFSYISKQKLEELPVTLRLAEKDLAGKNLFIHYSKYQKISITLSGIYYIEIKDKKAYIYHEEGIFTLRSPLEKILKKLDDNFLLCHRAYIVNKTQFVQCDIANNELILKNGLKCPYTSHRVKAWLT